MARRQRWVPERWAQAFCRELSRMLLCLHAVVDPEDETRFTIETKAGLLSIHIWDNWIACRFDDPNRALRLLGDVDYRLNRHSGKWNWNFDHTAGRPVQCVSDFEDGLRAIVDTLPRPDQ